MAVHTKTYLHTSATSDRVHLVLARILGLPFEVLTPEGGKCEPVEPCSSRFPWHLRFHVNSLRVRSVVEDISGGLLRVSPPAGSALEWHFHSETKEHESLRLVSASSTPLVAAVGKRLVDFFGGHLIVRDEDGNIQHEVGIAQSVMGRQRRQDTSNDRWCKFQNALLAEKPLLPQEILGMESLTQWERRDTDQCYGELLDHLRGLHVEALDAQWPEAAPARPRPRV